MVATLEAPSPEAVASDVAGALAEDVGDGDRTAALIPADTPLELSLMPCWLITSPGALSNSFLSA